LASPKRRELEVGCDVNWSEALTPRTCDRGEGLLPSACPAHTPLTLLCSRLLALACAAPGADGADTVDVVVSISGEGRTLDTAADVADIVEEITEVCARGLLLPLRLTTHATHSLATELPVISAHDARGAAYPRPPRHCAPQTCAEPTHPTHPHPLTHTRIHSPTHPHQHPHAHPPTHPPTAGQAEFDPPQAQWQHYWGRGALPRAHARACRHCCMPPLLLMQD
jgi:hypothetical protein